MACFVQPLRGKFCGTPAHCVVIGALKRVHYMRVLIVSDDPALVPSQAKAYSTLGWEVATGLPSFYCCAAPYELVHLHWPEELISWQLPTDDALNKLAETLRWWQKRARIVATVHNLMPHRVSEHPLDWRLYETVYSAADLIGHFSKYSLESVRALFPDVGDSKHVVHPPPLHVHMRELSVGRERARRRFNLTSSLFVILVFGALRKQSEFDLVMRCLASSDISNSRILFAGRFAPTTRWRRMLCNLRMEWLRRTASVQIFNGFIADDEATAMFEAADVVLIPRSGHHLNSGVVSLAMSLGTPIVAPEFGAFAEHLGGTMNVLYQPGNHQAMAAAIREIAKRDRSQISAANAIVALNWGWDKSVFYHTQAFHPACDPAQL
jgi:glycosyltransferase involved in cell wall biosynthesis